MTVFKISTDFSTVEFTYDALNRKLYHIQHKTSGNLTTRYTGYDAEGNLTEMLDARGQQFTYAYDGLNRLYEVVEDGTVLARYGYDKVGNRTSLVYRPDDPNSNQADTDGDGVGDVCDAS